MPRATFHIKQYKQVKIAAILSFAMILLSGVYFLQPFSPDNSYAADHTDTASGAYGGTTYSLTTTVSDLNLELKNVTPAGKAVYGKQTVNITTTAPGGYQLYMQTSGNLAGTKDGSATSDSIAALSANNSALDTNSWGYVTAASLSSASTTLDEDMDRAATQAVWNTPPSTLTQIDATSSAATSGRDTDIYYGIKADNTLTGDNYSGTITYTTIASDITSSDESTNGLTVTPTSSTANTATTLTITTPLMTTASLTAADITATVGSYSCTSISITSFTPLTFTCSTTPTTAGTYAVTATISKYSKTYTKTSAYTVTEDNTMQNFTATKCNALDAWTHEKSALHEGDTITLYDKRDNSDYAVRRLADGNCWMVQNLRLTNKVIATSDSDISGDFTIPASSLSTGTTDGAWGTSNDTNGNNHAVVYYNNNVIYGAYYNWYTATASSGTYATSYGDASYSICPKSWKLPYGGSNTSHSWYSLARAYGYTNSTSISPFAPHFRTATLTGSGYWAGYISDGSRDSVGARGYWWSSTAKSNSFAYNLNTTSDSVISQDNFEKRRGFSVRCVFVGE